MDEKREKFLAKLRETFREEAQEHLEAMTEGLLALEKEKEGDREVHLERVFREAHSLKGAARSVNFPRVEGFCVELESIFAAVKRGEMDLSRESMDAIHHTLGRLGTLCAGEGEGQAAAGEAEEDQVILEDLKRSTREESEPATKTPTSSQPGAGKITPGASRQHSRDTVRISTNKLGAVLQEAEELIGAKLAARTRATRLKAITAELITWNQQRPRQAKSILQKVEGTSPGPQVSSDLLESEVLFTRKLESHLRTLSLQTHEDAIALAGTSDRLLEDTKKLLLLPCSYLLGSFPKIARDLAREQGKEAALLVEGEDIEIDRRVLDELKDALTHLVRNCIDHGIEEPGARRALGKPEEGTISVTVKPIDGNQVELIVSDDGSGIRPETVRHAAVRLGIMGSEGVEELKEDEIRGLIFRSGFSTSPIITDLSGRGLGLAIAQEKVERLGGRITAESKVDEGTTFRLVVPLTMAAFRGVLVESAGRPFVIPTANVLRVTRVRPQEVRTVENRQTIPVGGEALSLAHLRDVLELPGPGTGSNGSSLSAVVLAAGGRRMAFVVDKVLGEQEVLVKQLGSQLPRVPNIAGASISGDGGVVPILHVPDLLETAVLTAAAGLSDVADTEEAGRRKRILIAEDSITARTLVKTILEGAGYEVVAAVDGMDALTRLKTDPFDLVVSDVDMPRMNGFQLTTRIRADKKLEALPVILVTALGDQKDREYGIQVGANAYLVKSDFDQSNLIEIIRRLL